MAVLVTTLVLLLLINLDLDLDKSVAQTYPNPNPILCGVWAVKRQTYTVTVPAAVSGRCFSVPNFTAWWQRHLRISH